MNKPLDPDLSAFPELPDLSERPANFGTAKIFPPLAKTEAEREASWQRFLDLANAGYMSDGTKMTRDEMNER